MNSAWRARGKRRPKSMKTRLSRFSTSKNSLYLFCTRALCENKKFLATLINRFLGGILKQFETTQSVNFIFFFFILLRELKIFLSIILFDKFGKVFFRTNLTLIVRITSRCSKLLPETIQRCVYLFDTNSIR